MKNLFLYIFILSGLNSFSQDKIGELDEGPVIDTKESKNKKNDAYQLVEVMPEFPGGNDSLKKFIVKNIKYPPYALESDIQGTCFVNFIVMPNGSIQHVKLIKGIGGGCNEEAIRLVKSMPKWKPGKQNGKFIPVYITLPIEFSLENPNDIQQSKAVIIAESIDSIETDLIEAAIIKPYAYVEVMPEFPGGDEAMNKYIDSVLKQLDTSFINKIDGTIFLNFVVETSGDVSFVKVTKGINKELDKEAVRIVKSMPKWKPGKQGGVNVPVYFDIPVHIDFEK